LLPVARYRTNYSVKTNFSDAIIACVGDIEIPSRIGGHSLGAIQRGVNRWTTITGESRLSITCYCCDEAQRSDFADTLCSPIADVQISFSIERQTPWAERGVGPRTSLTGEAGTSVSG